MPSFDIVSKPDMPSVNNAIDGAHKEKLILDTISRAANQRLKLMRI